MVVDEVDQFGAHHDVGERYASGTLNRIDAEPDPGHHLEIDYMFVDFSQRI